MIISTETCLHGLVDRSTGSLTGFEARPRTCETAKRCALLRFQPTALRDLCLRVSAHIYSSLRFTVRIRPFHYIK